MNPEVDHFISKAKQWKEELIALREILKETPLTEELKWKQPCYTYQGQNVLIMSAFNDYAFISFFKGSLLKDPNGVLHTPGENSRAARLLCFTRVKEIQNQKKRILDYIGEAIELEKAGKKVDFSKNRDMPYPEELTETLEADPELARAFDALTPGRKRGYLIYFNGAKQSQTRTDRIERSRENIFKGKGYQGR